MYMRPDKANDPTPWILIGLSEGCKMSALTVGEQEIVRFSLTLRSSLWKLCPGTFKVRCRIG